MKKHLILLSILLAAANVFSQPFYIKFVATGAATTLDSVEVKNLKKGTFLTLKGTDDLRLVKYVGIQNLSSGQEDALVFPSPMNERAELSFYAKEAGTAQITIYDISGKEVAGMSTNLGTGQQIFEVKGLHEGSYVVKVIGNNYQYNVKLMSINKSQHQPLISYAGSSNPQLNPILKTTMTTIDMPYSTGDTMRYTGYSGTYKAVVKNVPTSSLTVTFNFIPNLPILTTKAVSGITDNSAISGGNITSDQGYPVTARGVCWGTSPNPVDTNSHTSDGTGKGVFTSNITGLSDGTLYYVRAYATNIVGTSYGNQLSFTTTGRPTVTTTAISSKTDSSAKSGGNVISDGGYPVTARGICWDTSANPEISRKHTSDGSGTGIFTSNLSGLTTNTFYYVRAYATNSFGTAYGNQLSFKTADTGFICGISTVEDIEGNSYNTVEIGTQCWMKENLKTRLFQDGNPIPNVIDSATWIKLTTPAFCWYKNDSGTYENIYGKLYNWFTVNTGLLCPSGWHVPSDTEWTTLTDYLGGENVAGGKLKDTDTIYWINPNTGATNETGFSALPGGRRPSSGDFKYMGIESVLSSSTSINTSSCWRRIIYNYGSNVYRESGGGMKVAGVSVRCLKD